MPDLDEWENNGEDIEDDEENSITINVPEEQRRLVSEPLDFAILNLFNLEQDGDLILQPDFQRYEVWDNKKASKLIESVLINVPIPVVYLAEENDGTLSVIDGQQRLSTFINFMKGNEDTKLKSLNILSELNGKLYTDLSPEYQRRIKNTPIRCIVIKKESNPEIKYEIFERLNTGSVKLNAQELRNCVYRGKLNNTLKDLANDSEWNSVSKFTEKDKKRMLDCETILRFIAFYSSYNRYGSSLKRFLDTFMKENRTPSRDQITEYSRVFRKCVSLSRLVFGDKAFRKFTPGSNRDPNGKWEEDINKALMDAVLLGFIPYEQNDIVPKMDVIRENLVNLMSTNSEFVDAITVSTGDKRKVRARVEIWGNELRQIMAQSTNDQRLFDRQFRQDLFNQNNVCSICNQQIMLFEDASIDHVVAWSNGGQTIPSNARLAHRYCNSVRGNRS